ncbi:MAG: LVIVD repeat-containing protein [Ilumatobacteraceae bacterium]
MTRKIASSRSRPGMMAGALMLTLAFAAGSAVAGVSQSGEQRNMRRVGHTDLQGRPAYQPNVIQYPDGRTIAFVGTHGGSKPNPLKGGVVEQNGTMIIDVTDPDNPVEKFHIHVPVAGGQSQMARMCLGTQLDGTSNVYLMRNIQGSSASGFEVWNVSNVNAPVLVGAMRGIRSTHKLWWECSTGIAYLPGSLDVPYGFPLWRQPQSMLIVDWKSPAHPIYLRIHGLPGGQPSGTGAIPTSLHGPISAHDHPNAAGKLARGATASDIIGNRVYTAWGVGDDGVIQVLDRSKLLPPPYGTFPGDANNPTDAQLLYPQVSVLYMSPDQGGHTSMPIFGMTPRSFENFSDFKTRDIVVVTSEATSNKCQEAPHPAFLADFTVENSITVPPGTRLEPNMWQGPMMLSTMWVDPHLGDRYKRGNYCNRGARYGVHSSEENFRNPYYGKLTFLAYFTGGVRVWDIREPMTPTEVGFYVPVSNANTTADGYMTNNVEVDNRGLVYIVDRNGSGLDILRVTGKARRIVFENDPRRDEDDD